MALHRDQVTDPPKGNREGRRLAGSGGVASPAPSGNRVHLRLVTADGVHLWSGKPRPSGAWRVFRARTSRGFKLTLFAAAVLMAVASVGLAAILAHHNNPRPTDRTLTGPQWASFRLSYGERWRPLSRQELELSRRSAIAGLVRDTGSAKLFVLVVKRSSPDSGELLRRLRSDLRRRLPGFKQVGAKAVQLHGRRSLFFSFTDRAAKLIRAIVLLPSGANTFVISTEAARGDSSAGRELEQMIRSFTP